MLARVRALLNKDIFSTDVSQTPPRAPWLKKLDARSLSYWAPRQRPADLAAGAGRPRFAWRGALARASACTLRASARSARLRTRRTPSAFIRRALRAFYPPHVVRV